MKSDRNIVFLGMMGSGKTSIGFLVSKKLKLDFYDVDHYIENKLKMKILVPVLTIIFAIFFFFKQIL